MLGLIPTTGVVATGAGDLVASSSEPWLRLAAFDPSWAGEMVEITYHSSLLDGPARPIFRFLSIDGGECDRIGAATVAGTSVWIGRVPRDTVSMSVSPTHSPGPFDFRIETIVPRSFAALALRALVRSTGYGWRALALRSIGFRREADAMLSWALSSTGLAQYARWEASRSRRFDPGGIDRPRADWSATRVVCVVLPGDTPGDRAKTLASLRDQIFEDWSAIAVNAPDDVRRDDPRIEPAARRDLPARVQTWPDAAIVCVLFAGDEIPPHVLAYVVEQSCRRRADRVFYGDAIEMGAGVRVPTFRPRWSPRELGPGSPLPHPLFVRADRLRETEDGGIAFIETGAPSDGLLATGARHLHRPLVERPAATSPVPRSQSSGPIVARAGATATIVIPTRDNCGMLRCLVASMISRTGGVRLDIVVVNNGGSRARLDAALAGFSSAATIEIADHDDRFNFSTLCNLGARRGDGEVIVFLNDDMEVRSDGWLARLTAQALVPDIGAVGAKLTYPDGTLQHVGIVVGMAESAGHFGAHEPDGASGWAGRNFVVHEVSAVTGACLAVAREKFDAVGGFDAEHFPIELGDVDLCLRLKEKGWQTLLDPHVHLMHAESKSRGRATFRPLAVHESERSHFRKRWRHVLRDDPHFHPGLSLYSRQAALG